MHRAGSLPGLHPGHAGVRLQQVPAQEPAHPLRRHRNPGRLGGTPPQQAGRPGGTGARAVGRGTSLPSNTAQLFLTFIH